MITKSLIIGLLVPFFLINKINANPVQDEILGSWMVVEGNLLVQVYKEGEEFKAKIIWFNDSDDKSRPMHSRADNRNPDPALRNKKVLGMEVLSSLKNNVETRRWEGGYIYDPSSGKICNSSVSLNPNGILRVKGFWHFELLGKTMNLRQSPLTTQ